MKGDLRQCLVKLMILNTNPHLMRRKQQFYTYKELNQLGYHCIDHMPDNEYKAALQKLFEKYIAQLLQSSLQLKFNKSYLLNLDPAQASGAHHHHHLEQCKDHTQHNVNKLSKAFGLFEYSRCHDIFQNVRINGKPMYQPRDVATQLRQKYNRRVLNEEILKIKFILGVGGLNDILFIKAVLKKIDLMKRSFVLDLEQGQEVFIPHDLSCDVYPASFRYYDPIIQISNQVMSKQSKTYYSFKTEFNLNKIKNSDWQRNMLTQIGIYEAPNHRKVVHKHAVINIDDDNVQLQYTQTHHPMELQKSRYMLIDTTEESLKRQALM